MVGGKGPRDGRLATNNWSQREKKPAVWMDLCVTTRKENPPDLTEAERHK
jgi:hypothetical protein